MEEVIIVAFDNYDSFNFPKYLLETLKNYHEYLWSKYDLKSWSFEGDEYLGFSISPFVNTEEIEAQSSDLNWMMTIIPGKYQLLKWYVFKNIFFWNCLFLTMFPQKMEIFQSQKMSLKYMTID